MVHYDCEGLRKLLVESEDFSEIQDFFFTNFAEQPNFLRLGRSMSRARSQYLILAVTDAYHRYTKAEVVSVSCSFTEIPEFGMVHGPVNVNGKMGSMFHFKDLDMGLLCFVDDPKTGYTIYCRISSHPLNTPRPN